MNRPVQWVAIGIGGRFQVVGQFLDWYARTVGLESRWQMYSGLPTLNWWFVIHARYTDGSLIKLPLPRQSPRTFWQYQFFDIKEAKFHHSLFNDLFSRRAYASYLCRIYSLNQAALITDIVWETHWQNILDQHDTARLGTHLEAAIHSSVETYPCAPPQASRP